MSSLLSNILLVLIVGFGIGVLFSLLKLPIPAPDTMVAIMGIVGLWLGLVAVAWFRKQPLGQFFQR